MSDAGELMRQLLADARQAAAESGDDGMLVCAGMAERKANECDAFPDTKDGARGEVLRELAEEIRATVKWRKEQRTAEANARKMLREESGT